MEKSENKREIVEVRRPKVNAVLLPALALVCILASLVLALAVHPAGLLFTVPPLLLLMGVWIDYRA